MKYMGQTSRSFNTCFKEHLRDFRNGYGKSRFAQHLLENRHAISPMKDIMDTPHFTNKGQMMDMTESFYIFREPKLNIQINDRLTVKTNLIFKDIVQEDPHRGIHNTCSTQQQIPSQLDLSATRIHRTAFCTASQEVNRPLAGTLLAFTCLAANHCSLPRDKTATHLVKYYTTLIP